jgi:hypothetical protein
MGKQTEMAKSIRVSRPGPASDGDDAPTTPLRVSDADSDEKLASEVDERLADLGIKSERSDIRRGTNPALQDDDEDDFEEFVDDEGTDDEDNVDDDGQENEDDPADMDADDDEPDGEEEPEGLPDALLRSAVAYGFGNEKTCRKFYKDQPQRAISVFNSIYNARMQAMNDFAAEGRRQREQSGRREETSQVDERTAALNEKLAAAKEKLGEDAEPLFDVIRMQQEMLTQNASQPEQTSREPVTPFGDQFKTETVADEFAVEQQINLFFESDRMKPWGKVYGTIGFGETFDDLTPANQKHRHDVLKRASDIVAGAQVNRRKITMNDALESAHLIVTQKYRDQVLIDGVKREVKKRNDAISMRPSRSKARKSKVSKDLGTPGSRTPEQLERAVTLKMRKVLGS